MTSVIARGLAITALFAAMTACKPGTPEDQLAARVNGEGISKGDFNDMVDRSMARYRGKGNTALPEGIETRIKESVLRRMIDDKVIELKARDLGVDIDEKALNEKFEQHKARFRTEEGFSDYLKRSGNTEKNMKADLGRNMRRDNVVDKLSGEITITDEEIKKYYDDNLRIFEEKEQVKISRILVKVRPDAPVKDKKSAEKRAKKLRSKAAKSGADFGEIAKAESEGQAASRRGDQGWMTRGRMQPEVDNFAFTAKAGEVSKPIKTRDGYEIIKLFERRDSKQRELEAVKDNIRLSLTARRRNELRRSVLKDLKTQATVEQLLTFDRKSPPPGSPPPGQKTAAQPVRPKPVKPFGRPPAPKKPAAGSATP